MHTGRHLIRDAQQRRSPAHIAHFAGALDFIIKAAHALARSILYDEHMKEPKKYYRSFYSCHAITAIGWLPSLVEQKCADEKRAMPDYAPACISHDLSLACQHWFYLV